MPNIIVPPAFNYPNALVMVPDNSQRIPPEGNALINCEIDWGTTDNGLGCVNFNLSNNATLNFSQINAIVADNSNCGADIDFIFPDTGVSVTIPAYLPYAIIPVYTHQTQFFVNAVDTALSTDVTKFTILNYQPAPLAIPTTNHQNAAVADDIAGTNSTTVIIPATINGTLENVSVQVAVNSNSSSFATLQWKLVDGSNNIIATGRLVTDFGATFSNPLLQLNNVSVRFTNGIEFVIIGAISQSYFDVNLYYRTP